MKGKWVSVPNSATVLVDQSAGHAGSATKPTSVAILNPSGNETLYIGGADVNTTTNSTAGTGFPIAAGSQITVDLQGDTLYGRFPSAGPAWVNVLIVGSY